MEVRLMNTSRRKVAEQTAYRTKSTPPAVRALAPLKGRSFHPRRRGQRQNHKLVHQCQEMLSEAATTGVQHPQVATNEGNVAETHKQRNSCNLPSGTEDTDMAIMELGKQVTQTRTLNAQSNEAVNHVSDLKIQQQAVQDGYTALESKAHEEEARTQEFVAEAQKLRQQASEAEGRAADLRKQSVRSMGEARRGREQHREREEGFAKAEDEALKIKERLQEVKRALGID
ncbi:hypothetical protein LTR94_018518 [Friedmanniomyces endolithicus]|nr:hypothetical protein LTR94_018518 [Friedmanniomyces endolithicus]KAK0778307.1 hypothetical protein LTR38_014831 [Friedmanniomyces endolithicus]